jgi:carbon-monoxide dehydrogenase large subunit
MTDARSEPRTWTGRALPRLEDPAIVRGWGSYVGDIAARDTGCLHARFVRSPHASGRLVSVTAPSGVTLFTAADLDDVQPIRAFLNRPDFVAVDTPILATDRVRFVGEPVALVVAASESEAEDAVDLVEVVIEPLPAVVSAAHATAPGAPLVHDVHFPGDPNTVVDGRLHTDGFDEAFAGADHVVRIEVSSARQSAMPLEARAAHAAYDRASGRSTLHATLQMPHVTRTGITDCLGIPEDDLRVVAPDVGGGFGAKMTLAREDVALVWASRRLRRNVAWLETREENFLGAWHSREQVYDIEGAFSADGELLALRGDLVCDVGAYCCYPVTWGVEPLMAMAELPGPYRVREYSVRSRGIVTNKCPIAPYRGVSRPMQVLAIERLLDVAADELGLDKVTIRDANLVSEFPHRSPSGLVLDAASHRETLAAAVELAGLEDFRARQAEARTQGRYLGIGISCFAERTGYGTPAFVARSRPFKLGTERASVITPGFERVILTMDPSGTLTLRIGAAPHGQGLKTTLAQLVCDELGLRPEAVRVIASDTDQTPYGWGSFASRAMVIAGGASMLAAQDLAERLRGLAADRLGCLPDDVELIDGWARLRDGAPGDDQVALAVLARDVYHSSHLLPDKGEPALESVGFYDPTGTFANACHVAEVEVDVATGRTVITRFLVAEDAGRLINPAIVDGQIHGGIAQGVANALYEELIYDERGVLVTTSLLDYLPPTVAEMPHVDIVHLETLSPASVTGAKGVGEGGTIGAPAAIANAISDALSPFGVGVFHLPATPHRIRTAIRTGTDVHVVPLAVPPAVPPSGVPSDVASASEKEAVR